MLQKKKKISKKGICLIEIVKSRRLTGQCKVKYGTLVNKNGTFTKKKSEIAKKSQIISRKGVFAFQKGQK